MTSKQTILDCDEFADRFELADNLKKKFQIRQFGKGRHNNKVCRLQDKLDNMICDKVLDGIPCKITKGSNS